MVHIVNILSKGLILSKKNFFGINYWREKQNSLVDIIIVNKFHENNVEEYRIVIGIFKKIIKI